MTPPPYQRTVTSNPTGEFRLALYHFIIALGFAVLLLRTAYIQISQADFFRLQSEHNHIQVDLLQAQRGLILDWQGNILAQDNAILNAVVWDDQQSRSDVGLLLAKLAARIQADPEQLYRNYLRSSQTLRPFQHKPVLEDLTPSQLGHLETYAEEFPGIRVAVALRRHYRYPSLAAHLIGYMNELTPEEYQDWKNRGYHFGDWCGRTGIERLTESYLHGANGYQWLEVDARQHRVQVLDNPRPIPPRQGANVYLTIDLALQQAAEAAFPADKNGAVVGIDPRNGKIRVMVSRPAYDSNAFVERRSQAVNRYRSSPDNPLLNRAIAGQYPAGSTFKIVDALAALATGDADTTTHLSCSGSFRIGNAVFDCWKAGGHGSLDLIGALRQSCNVFFYQLGLRVGAGPIAAMARRLGLGSLSHIKLPGEAAGLVPDAEWKAAAGARLGLDRKWQGGDTANLAIGQGALLVTPLQMANLISAVANGGLCYRPLLIERIVEEDGQVVFQAIPEVQHNLELRPAVWATVRSGLEAVVANGTGRRARQFPDGSELTRWPAGKTGTAQVGDRNRNGITEPEEIAHGWFVSYWPADDPELALAVFVEHGGSGGASAAPVAREIFAVLDREQQ